MSHVACVCIRTHARGWGGHSVPFSDVLAVALTTETQLRSGWGNIRCGNLESDSPQRGLPHAASERAWPFA